MNLLPREEKFFEYFHQQVNFICQAADLLAEGAASGNAHLASAAHQIKAIEEQADTVIHEIYTRLNSTFITPLDPEDIHSLSSHLDDVIDGIEDSVHRMLAYRIDPLPGTVMELCRLVQSCGLSLLKAFEALAKGDMLAIIFVAILLGVGTLVAGEAGRPFAGLLQSATAVLLKIVGIVMEATPFGVFALIANAVATNGAAVFVNVGWLALAVVIGSAIQILLVHSLLLRFVARVPLLHFFRGIIDALAVAFSTASSSATLPVAMRVAERNLGIGRPIYATVLPLGASIGKDGTAMYVGLLSLFSLQALGVPLTPSAYGLVLLTGALAAFGTAPVPSASLFMLAAVLSSVGVAPEQTALVVGFVLPFDRLLDMTRTVPSASANLTVATTVARWEEELDDDVLRSPNDE